MNVAKAILSKAKIIYKVKRSKHSKTDNDFIKFEALLHSDHKIRENVSNERPCRLYFYLDEIWELKNVADTEEHIKVECEKKYAIIEQFLTHIRDQFKGFEIKQYFLTNHRRLPNENKSKAGCKSNIKCISVRFQFSIRVTLNIFDKKGTECLFADYLHAKSFLKEIIFLYEFHIKIGWYIYKDRPIWCYMQSKLKQDQPFILNQDHSDNLDRVVDTCIHKYDNDPFDTLYCDMTSDETDSLEIKKTWDFKVIDHLLRTVFSKCYPKMKVYKILCAKINHNGSCFIKLDGDCIFSYKRHTSNFSFCLISERTCTIKCTHDYCLKYDRILYTANTIIEKQFRTYKEDNIKGLIFSLIKTTDKGVVDESVSENNDTFTAAATKKLLPEIQAKLGDDKSTSFNINNINHVVDCESYRIVDANKNTQLIIHDFNTEDGIAVIYSNDTSKPEVENDQKSSVPEIKSRELVKIESKSGMSTFCEKLKDYEYKNESCVFIVRYITGNFLPEVLADLYLSLKSNKEFAFDKYAYFFYNPLTGLWNKWTDINYILCDVSTTLNKLIDEIFMLITEDIFTPQKTLLKKMISLHQKSHNFLKHLEIKIIYKFHSDGFEDFLDSNMKIIAFDNCVVDLENFQIHPHSAHFLISFKLKYSFPGFEFANSVIKDVISTMMPDTDIREYIFDFLATVLSDRVPNKYIHLFVGSGSNGKSLLMRILILLLDKYISTYSSSFITCNSDQESNPAFIPLKSKRLAYITDSSSYPVSIGMIRTLSNGGEVMTTRPLFDNQLISYNYHTKIVLCCKSIPTFECNDESLEDRIYTIPFNMKFVELPTLTNECKINTNLWNEISGSIECVQGFMVFLIKRYRDLLMKNFEKTVPNISRKLKNYASVQFNTWLNRNIVKRSGYILDFQQVFKRYNNISVCDCKLPIYRYQYKICSKYIMENEETFGEIRSIHINYGNERKKAWLDIGLRHDCINRFDLVSEQTSISESDSVGSDSYFNNCSFSNILNDENIVKATLISLSSMGVETGVISSEINKAIEKDIAGQKPEMLPFEENSLKETPISVLDTLFKKYGVNSGPTTKEEVTLKTKTMDIGEFIEGFFKIIVEPDNSKEQ